MIKSLKIALIFMLASCSVFIATSQTAQASESSLDKYAAIAVYPSANYGMFDSILHMALDDGAIYVLQDGAAGYSVVAHKDGNKIFNLTEGLDYPEKIRVSGGILYIYDSGKIKIYAENTYMSEVSVETTYRDFDVYGGVLYILEVGALKKCDVSDINSIGTVEVVDGAIINRAEQISVSGNMVYYLEKKAGQLPDINIHCYNMVTEATTLIKNYDQRLPADRISAAGGYIAITTKGGSLKIINADTKQVVENATIGIDASGDVEEGKLLSVCSMSFLDSGELYISDDIGRSVQRFRFTAGKEQPLAYDDFYLGSFSSSGGRFFLQTDIYEFDGKKYILDGGNNRLQIFGDGVEEIQLGAITDELKYIAVAADKKIYVASATGVYSVDHNGDSSKIRTGENITGIHVTLNSDVYVSDGNKIYDVLSGNQIISVDEQIVAFSADLMGTTFIVATPTKLVKTDGKVSQEVDEQQIIDIDVDFANNIFVLRADGEVSKISFGLLQQRSIIIEGVTFEGEVQLPLCHADRLCIDKSTGAIFLNFKSQHIVAMIDDKVMKGATELDVPKLLPTIDILDKLPNDGKTTVSKITGWPSTIVYPFHEDYKDENVYPDGKAHLDIVKVSGGTTVMVVEKLDGYCYVLIGGKAGFVLSNNIEELPSVAPPMVSGEALHGGSVVYKFPQSTGTKLDGSYTYDFECDKIDKGTPISLMDSVYDIKDVNGVLWYRIGYGGDKIGYIARINVTQDSGYGDNFERTGKIKADITYGEVAIRDRASDDGGVITAIKDATIVKVLKDYGNGWLYIEGTDVAGNLVNGFIREMYVTAAPLTTAQIVGICLICSTVVLLIISFVVFWIFRKNKTKKFD